MKDIIEIPFGAHDSELKSFEYTIPEGYEAEIKDGKVIVRQKESENERMIRILKEGFEGLTVFNYISVDKILSWLDQQKEQKVDIDKLRKDLYQSGYNDGYQHGKEDTQKEHKPAEWSEDIIRKAVKEVGLTQHQINWFENNVFPPKQEWSEEDKDYFDVIIKKLEVTQDDALLTDNQINFLKSLSERFNLQPKTEWSEEDERMLNVAIRSCEQTIEDYPNDKVRFNDCIAWLKLISLNLKKKNEDIAKLCSNEWSDEDEKMLHSIIEVLEVMPSARFIPIKRETMIPWLEALHERFNLPPKQEWSEEEQHMIDRVEYSMRVAMCIPDNIIKWTLEHLRPQPQGTYKQVIHTIFGMLKDKDFYEIQPSHRVSLLNDIRVKCKDAIECAPIIDEPHWKPSEEQMEVLGRAITFLVMHNEEFRRTGHNNGLINDLYNDLKKLM